MRAGQFRSEAHRVPVPVPVAKVKELPSRRGIVGQTKLFNQLYRQHPRRCDTIVAVCLVGSRRTWFWYWSWERIANNRQSAVWQAVGHYFALLLLLFAFCCGNFTEEAETCDTCNSGSRVWAIQCSQRHNNNATTKIVAGTKKKGKIYIFKAEMCSLWKRIASDETKWNFNDMRARHRNIW